MRTTLLGVIALTSFGAAASVAQAVPEGSQAMKVESGYRRSPLIGVDPFRNVMVPRWGLVISAGASAENNAFSFRDVGAVTLIDSDDKLGIADYIDLVSLLPRGQGFTATAEGETSAYLGMSFGRRLTLGFSAGARTYGSVTADDRLVTFFRDGNTTTQNFTVGSSRARTLTTADAGAHAVLRFGPLGTIDGVHLSAGFGARMVRPIWLVDARSSVVGGGSFSIGTDSIRANVGMEIFSSFPLDSTDGAKDYLLDRARGDVGSSGLVGDLLLRLEWPTSGVALEGMLVNLGAALTVEQVGHGADTLLIQTNSLDSLREAVDSLDFDIRDSMDVDVRLPQIWRVSGSAWANRILQLDVTASGSLKGDIDVPLSVGLGTTWRLVRHLPLRAGVTLGGAHGIGYAGGFAIEARNFLFRVTAQSLGGLFQNATGAGGRFDFGFFF